MQWIDLDGVALRHELDGSGQRIVVLFHEMGGTLDSWDLMLPALQRRYRTLRFDMRGFGLSEKIRDPVTVERLADDARDLLVGLGIDQPVALVGCAVGAAVALCFAGRHPQRTAAVVVTSPATGIAPSQRPATLERIRAFERDGLRAVADASLDLAYPEDLRAADPERFRSYRARWLCNDPESFAAVYRMLVDLELDPHLAAIRAPVLVVSGTLDPLRPPEAGEAVARRIPGADFAAIRSGHVMALQTPDALAELAIPFLETWRDPAADR